MSDEDQNANANPPGAGPQTPAQANQPASVLLHLRTPMEDTDTERQKHLCSITRKLIWFTLGCLVCLLFFFYVILPKVGEEHTGLGIFVFLAGLLGGFVSIQQRLPDIKLNELKQLSESWCSILLIPVNGGIFAIVLMLMFLSEILEGGMFPKFHHPVINHGDLFSTFKVWLTQSFPEKGVDIAKLLFWSFVAGFSERFVPQIIRTQANESIKPSSNG